nr:hypothetical protein [Tanacetum cinerariifolium]
MHSNIMAAGLRDRPPMLATGRYAQWQSCFLRYIDTRPNGDALRKCILEGRYTLSTIIIPVVPATDNALVVLKRTTVETILNMYPGNNAHFESKKEAIHLLLTGIRDEIYSTVDACKTAHEMVKDSTYHNEKMLLCKQAKKGVPLQAEQSDWLADTDDEINEQELEAHYNFMAKIQEIDSNVIPNSPDMCDNDTQTDQNVVECDDECVALANLIENLKVIDENKKIQKQLKKENTSLAHE